MAKITMNSLPTQLTSEELAEVEVAEKMPITFDDDCPEIADNMLKQFHKMNNSLSGIMYPIRNDL